MSRASRRFGGSPRVAVAAAAAAAGLLGPGSTAPTRAAVYVFDPGNQAPPTTASDGAGNWDATTADWYNTASGAVGPWGNTTADTAVFGVGGTAGNVSVGTVNVGTISFNAVGGSYVLNNGTITLGGAATIVANAGVSATIGSTVTGTSGLVKAGAGTLTLTNFNTFTGGTTVNAGTLNLSSGGGPGVVGGALTINSGATVNATAQDAIGYVVGPAVSTLTVNAGGTFVLAAPVNGSSNGNEGYVTNLVLNGGSVTSTQGGQFNFNTGYGISSNASSTTATISSGILMRGSSLVVTTATGTTASGNDLVISGPINASSGTATFTKAGAGRLVVSGTNIYTGPTAVNAGTLQAGSTQAFGVNSAVTVASGATLDLVGINNSIGSLAGSGVVSLGAGTLTVGTDNTSTTFSGNINNGSGGSLVKVGTGTLTLANYDNNFTGGTTVNGGTLNLNNNYNSYYGTVSGAITINNGGTVTAPVGDAIGYGGGVGTSVTVINVNAGGTFDIATSGNEGYRTNVVLTGGKLSASGGGTFNFTTNYGITSNASSTTATFSAGIDIRDGSTLPVAVAAGTTASGSDLTISGTIFDGQYGGGASALAKTGAGTLTLSGPNTYKGGTTISQGTVRANAPLGLTGTTVTNSSTGTGTVTVAGGVLAGTGGTGPVLIASGGTITAGTGATTASSAGTLTTTTEAWNSGGGYVAKYDATGTADRLIMSGLAVQTGAPTPFAVNFQTASGGTGNVASGTYILATDTGAAASSDPFALASLALKVNNSQTLPAGFTYAERTDTTAGGGTDLDLVVTTAAPEPTTAALVGAAVAPLVVGRRRRRAGGTARGR